MPFEGHEDAEWDSHYAMYTPDAVGPKGPQPKSLSSLFQGLSNSTKTSIAFASFVGVAVASGIAGWALSQTNFANEHEAPNAMIAYTPVTLRCPTDKPPATMPNGKAVIVTCQP